MLSLEAAKELSAKLGLDSNKLLDIGCGMFTYCEPITVTPEMAASWLRKFNTENRKPKSQNVERIANDLLGDRWHVTHQGMAFRDIEVLADGQNRLIAIVRTKKTVQVRVFLGLSREAVAAIDGNAPRTMKDHFHFQGKKVPSYHTAALKAFLVGRDAKIALSPEAMVQEWEKWQEELKFAFEFLPKKKRMTATVYAVIMRAYYNYKHDPEIVERLKEFCTCIHSGKNINHDVLSNYHNGLLEQNYGGQARKVLYPLTEDVLYHYLFTPDEPKKPRSLPAGERFPLYEEYAEVI